MKKNFLRFCIKRKKLYCFLEGSMKKRFSSELAYILGIVLVALGVVFMEKADFGVSMVVAPAYILYRWLSPIWGFFTFGMAEYCLQAAADYYVSFTAPFSLILSFLLRYGGDIRLRTGWLHAVGSSASDKCVMAKNYILCSGYDDLLCRSIGYVPYLYLPGGI